MCNLPIRFGTKRKTFSEYVCAVARSTANFASTTSIAFLRCPRDVPEVIVCTFEVNGESVCAIGSVASSECLKGGVFVSRLYI
jgi:hypothetical protein